MGDRATYRRGQVEWALWRFFLQGRQARRGAERTFRTRIKRLLELDRGERLDDGKSQRMRFAFADERPAGRGSDAPFRSFDAFCLALALDLLDMGFKQSEIVLVLRHMRGELETWYARILRSPPPARQRALAKHRPGAPTYTSPSGVAFADLSVFVAIKKIEIKEIFAAADKTKHSGGPIILEPVFCRGVDELTAELRRMSADNRKLMIVEIAHTATDMSAFLKAAPLVKRGRP